MKGLSVNIYRSDLGDCTNGGVTSPARAGGRIFVVFDEWLRGGNYTLGECTGNPGIVCLRVVRRRIRGAEYLHLEPMHGNPEGCAGPMAGGNFAYTSDSRFHDLSDRPLPVHDRFETWEQHDALSR